MNSVAQAQERAMDSIEVAGVALVADLSGALYAPAARALIVADLHLEKGSSFARRGALLPPYDTAITLARLSDAIARLRPRLVVALGDSFHDSDGPNRLGAADRAALAALQAGRDWLWVSGNHDPALPACAGGDRDAEWRLGPLVFRHAPTPGRADGEVAGHLHPVAVVGGRRRAFVGDGRRLILPAFGAYAGGLNLRHPALAGLFAGRRVAYVLGRDRVYAVCASRCG